ncbi:hypothetical protein GCM10018780_90620 [Streptomyces lanatus]|nr:hypothetical protein GCM10018780_90620 [Streptomyces lanatus]
MKELKGIGGPAVSEQVEQWIAITSLAIPLFAFLWEFAVVGRKRLGYRVQMDTVAANQTQSAHAEILEQLERDGHQLKDPSFVLLRIENAGSAPIEAGDYLTDENDPSGIWVTFRRRQVAGIVVTELSQRELRRFFRHGAPGYGFRNTEAHREGVIELPKVKLPRGAEYKILVILERWPDDTSDQDFPKPDIVGAVGTDRRWFDPLVKYFRFKLTRTESHLFASRPAWFAITFLALAVVVHQSSPSSSETTAAPRWTASAAPCTCTAPPPSPPRCGPPPRTTSTAARERAPRSPSTTTPSRAAAKASPRSSRPATTPGPRSARASATTSRSPTASPPPATPG